MTLTISRKVKSVPELTRSDDHRTLWVLSLEDTGVFFIIARICESGWRERRKHYQSKLTLHAKSNMILLIRSC